MAQETGPYQVFSRTVYAFGGCRGRIVRLRAVSHFDILHCSVYAFCDILYLVCQMCHTGGDECFHAPAARTDIGKHGAEEGIVEQGTAHPGGFFVGVEMVYVYHNQTGRGLEALAVAAGECAAGSHVGQECGFCRSHIRSVTYLLCQDSEILVAGNHLENLFHRDFAERKKCGGSDYSSLFVSDGRNWWHEI